MCLKTLDYYQLSYPPHPSVTIELPGITEFETNSSRASWLRSLIMVNRRRPCLLPVFDLLQKPHRSQDNHPLRFYHVLDEPWPF